MKSLKAREVLSDGKISGDCGEPGLINWDNLRSKHKPRPEKPDFIKEEDFKV